MSEPKRVLSDPSASALQKRLVAAWTLQRPPAGTRERTLAALGIAAASGTAATGKVAGSVAPKAAAGIAWAKWLALGVVVLGVAGAAVALSRHASTSGPSPAAPSAPAAPAASTPRVAAPSAEPAPTPVDDLPAPPPAPASAPRLSGTSAAREAARPEQPGLAEQLAALESARNALDTGDAARAERLALDYETTYPHGAFLQEAEVLRIQALAKEGKRDDAAHAAERFVATYPKSPHLGRLRGLLP